MTIKQSLEIMSAWQNYLKGCGIAFEYVTSNQYGLLAKVQYLPNDITRFTQVWKSGDGWKLRLSFADLKNENITKGKFQQ